MPKDGEAAGATGPRAERLQSGTVSEVVWGQWRASVVKHGLGEREAGPLRPQSAEHDPRDLEHAAGGLHRTRPGRNPLDEDPRREAGPSDPRGLPQRPHAGGQHGHPGAPGGSDRPPPDRQVEQWIGRVLQTPGVPSQEEIFENFVRPLLEQVRTDATQQIASLAENRLGICGPITSVRQAARSMGLTRARVYQLLNEINDIMAVRWPMGRHQVYELREKLDGEAEQMDPPPDLQQFYAAVELFYPGSRRGAAGPLEHTDGLHDEEEDDAEEMEHREGHEEEHLVEAH